MLLGFITREPLSGYGLKKRFSASPAGLYQPSPGALYPALRRLELKGLVQAQADQNGNSARQRRVYELTQTGQAAHLSWLRTPIEPATVARDLGLHLMRFVMMEHQLPPVEVLAFLRDLADELGAFTAQLERYAAAADLDNTHARLALDHGLAVHRASLQWAERTIAALSATPPRP